jgi:hypothetical protein
MRRGLQRLFGKCQVVKRYVTLKSTGLEFEGEISYRCGQNDFALICFALLCFASEEVEKARPIAKDMETLAEEHYLFRTRHVSFCGLFQPPYYRVSGQETASAT